LAILQLFNIDPFVDIDNQEFLFRVYSTIGQPNFLGQFLIFPFFIIFFSITNFYKNKKYKSLILNSLLLLAILIIIYFTKNRATWLAMSISLFFYLILFLDIKTIYKKISILSCFIL